MRRNIWGIGIGILLLFLTGCSGEQEIQTPKESKFSSEEEYLCAAFLAESDDGLYYVETDQDKEIDVLCFADRKTSKKTVLCQKVNCKHDSDTCEAVTEMPNMLASLVYSDGILYSLEYEMDEERTFLRLYSRNSDGTEKKMIHTFENAGMFPCQAALYKGKFFVSVQIMREAEDGLSASSAEPSILMYDLKTKEERIIVDGFEEEGIYTGIYGGKDNTIYIGQFSMYEEDRNGPCTVKQYDFETEKWSEVCDITIKDAQIIENDVVYLQPTGKYQLEQYNLQTKESKTVLNWDEDVKQVFVVLGYAELEKEVEIDGEKQLIYNWYDLEKQEYLFEEYQNSNHARIRMKLREGYCGNYNGEMAFYDIDEKKWQELEAIK